MCVFKYEKYNNCRNKLMGHLYVFFIIIEIIGYIPNLYDEMTEAKNNY